jgi:hypothetical protein
LSPQQAELSPILVSARYQLARRYLFKLYGLHGALEGNNRLSIEQATALLRRAFHAIRRLDLGIAYAKLGRTWPLELADLLALGMHALTELRWLSSCPHEFRRIQCLRADRDAVRCEIQNVS